LFKGCLRCRGDLYREEDIGQVDLVCLQCGFRQSAEPIPVFGVRTETIRPSRNSRPSERPDRVAA
jgi:hypothetical protein